MSRPRRYLLVAGLLVLAGLVAFSWQLFRHFYPNAFDAEMVDAGELAKLKAATLAPPPPAGPDWPRFRGPNNDGIASSENFNTDWKAKPPTEAWKTPCGGGYGSVAVADGRVYVQDRQGGNERLLCLNAADGKQLWADEYPADYSQLKAGYDAGPRATPTIHDGRAYTVGAVGQFRCLKLNGDSPPTLLWEHVLLTAFAADTEQMRWGFASSPLVEGELVIVQPCGKKGAVAAFDRITGEQRWAVGNSVGGYSSPVAGTFGGVRQVVAVTGDAILGIGVPDGRKLWEHPWTTQFKVNAASPVVAGEFVFVSSEYNKGCVLLRVDASGARPVFFKPKAAGMKTKHNTVVHRDGFVYGFDGEKLSCMNLREGELVEDWGPGNRADGVKLGTVVLVADKLLVQQKDDGLVLVAADPTDGRVVGRGGFTQKDAWATPAVVAGRIYTRDGSHVVCVDATK